MIDRAIDQLARDVEPVATSLRVIAQLLDVGAGEPFGDELTPEQSRRIVDVMGPIGALGAALLERDLRRTALREDDGLDP